MDSAASDIRHAVATLPSLIADIQSGIERADVQLQSAQKTKAPHIRDLAGARAAATKALDAARTSGSADPFGAFTEVTKADADLNRLLATVAATRDLSAGELSSGARLLLGKHLARGACHEQLARTVDKAGDRQHTFAPHADKLLQDGLPGIRQQGSVGRPFLLTIDKPAILKHQFMRRIDHHALVIASAVNMRSRFYKDWKGQVRRQLGKLLEARRGPTRQNRQTHADCRIREKILVENTSQG